MKKWGGGQLDIRPPHSKNWGGGRVPPSPPGLTPLSKRHIYMRLKCLVKNNTLN